MIYLKIQVQGIHHVQLCIPIGEEEKARQFYSGVLGFSEMDKPNSLKKNGGLWYEAGGQQLHLGVENTNFAKGKSHPAFQVAQLQHVKQYLENNGVTINEEIEIPGISRFSFRDPFGNRIEFLETMNAPKG